jgi:RNA polymerase sigma factor (sigma-70 family)
MTAVSKTSEGGKDPVTAALEERDVINRLHCAARAILGRRIPSLLLAEIIAGSEEIVSESIEKVLSRKHDYSPDCGDVVAWIVGFINNVAREYSKKHFRQPTGPPPDGPQLEDLARDLGRPATDTTEEKEFISRLLEKLPAKYKRLIELVYYEDLNFEEIGERMNLKASTARVQHCRILNLLRELCGVPKEVQS